MLSLLTYGEGKTKKVYSILVSSIGTGHLLHGEAFSLKKMKLSFFLVMSLTMYLFCINSFKMRSKTKFLQFKKYKNCEIKIYIIKCKNYVSKHFPFRS